MTEGGAEQSYPTCKSLPAAPPSALRAPPPWTGEETIATQPTPVYSPVMTPEILERDWLSLRYWLQRCVLPSAIFLIVVLGGLRLIDPEAVSLNHKAVIVGFFVFYFILVRGGHLIMIRSLHFELKRKYEDSYRERLAYVPIGQIKRRNIGFTLARIKREIIDMKIKAKR